jgi:hypothetical protein
MVGTNNALWQSSNISPAERFSQLHYDVGMLTTNLFSSYFFPFSSEIQCMLMEGAYNDLYNLDNFYSIYNGNHVKFKGKLN